MDAFASPNFEEVCRDLPDLTIVIEHLKSGGQDTAPPRDRYRKVLSLARYPNTYMKVVGFGEMCPRPMPCRQPFPFEDVPPLTEMMLL